MILLNAQFRRFKDILYSNTQFSIVEIERYSTLDSQETWDLRIFFFNSQVLSERQLVDRGQLKGEEISRKEGSKNFKFWENLKIIVAPKDAQHFVLKYFDI